jgi:predicted lactoylglutathione lyase
MFAFIAFVVVISSLCGAGEEIVSSMRNVNAIADAGGFSIAPAYQSGGETPAGDYAPVQIFEIVRPAGRAVAIGRLFTSGREIRVEAAKRRFDPGEQALLTLRNIEPTPPTGQVFTIYVQVVMPLRVTLKYDVFVQSHLSEPPVVPDVPLFGGAPPEIIDLTNPQPPPAETNPVRMDEVKAEMDRLFDDNSKAANSEPGTTTSEADDIILSVRKELEQGVAAVEEAVNRAFTSPEPSRLEKNQVEEMPPAEGKEAESVVEPMVSGTSESATLAADSIPSAANAGIRSDPPLPFVSLITIGVSDLGRLADFYEKLGWWRISRNSADQAVFFQLNGQILVLYSLTDLLREQNMAAAKPSPGSVTLALHVTDKAAVEENYRRFLDAGASSLREPTEMPSGAVTCYVADPDGNPWEVSWVPRFRIDAGGGLWLP